MIQIMDYSSEPVRDILCIDVKSFFASVEAVERKQHPLRARIAVVSKPDNNGGLVLAASPLVKQLYGVKTGTRVYEIPKDASIEIVEPRMALYVEKNLEIVDLFKRFVADCDLHVYSIDESFLDVTNSHGLFGTTEEIARKIQLLIWKKMNLVVTVGIGTTPSCQAGSGSRCQAQRQTQLHRDLALRRCPPHHLAVDTDERLLGHRLADRAASKATGHPLDP
ncbi:MAG: type VI secretion protein ImpB [Alkalibacterium sp.]|nr:type VI secretion protein ImpB [Alkalibacterium sp.]